MSPYRAFLYVVLIMLSVNSCSNINKIIKLYPDHDGIHPHLKDIILEVKELSDGCLGHIKYAGFLEDKTSNDRILGRASWILPFMEPQIGVNPKHWYKLAKVQKIMLVAHELYHAETPYLGHIDGKDEWGCANHLMYYQSQGRWCDMFKYKQYVEQMKDCK